MYKDTIVEFYRTHNRYKVLCVDSKMKDPSTGDWLDAVIYQEEQVLGENGEYEESVTKAVYVREKLDFIRKFNLSMKL